MSTVSKNSSSVAMEPPSSFWASFVNVRARCQSEKLLETDDWVRKVRQHVPRRAYEINFILHSPRFGRVTSLQKRKSMYDTQPSRSCPSEEVQYQESVAIPG